MSIYATLWWLKFPRYGDEYVGCEWIRVSAQGVPAHIGTPTRGFGYEDGDPYAEFLPPAVEVNAEGDSEFMRAVVIVTEETHKGTARSPQEYANPLVILSGPGIRVNLVCRVAHARLRRFTGDRSRGRGTIIYSR